MKTAIYARSARDEQEADGGIQQQVVAGQQWAAQNGHTCTDSYIDRGVSGTTPLGERPQGQRLLRDAAQGKFDGVVVKSLDRISRTPNQVDEAQQVLEEHGVRLVPVG